MILRRPTGDIVMSHFAASPGSRSSLKNEEMKVLLDLDLR